MNGEEKKVTHKKYAMAKEIERKFLVDMSKFNPCGEKLKMKQGYLASDSKCVVRVRTSDDKAFITVKSDVNGVVRNEFEYSIPFSDALEMFSLCKESLIEKIRWEIPFAEKIWEVDVFEGDNEGLVVAEIELTSEFEHFEKPEWATTEVSTDARYFNFNLSKNPYKNWAR